jgi:hypothetical protein
MEGIVNFRGEPSVRTCQQCQSCYNAAKDRQLNASIMVAFKFHAVVNEVWTVGGNLWKIGSLVGHYYIASAGFGKRPNGVPGSGLYTEAAELRLLGFRLSLFSHPSLVFTRPPL